MYAFLLASLPALTPETPAPMSPEKFDEAVAAALIGEKERGALASFDGNVRLETKSERLPRVYREYLDFERFLRTVIARRRADRAGEALDLPAPAVFSAEAALAVNSAAGMTPPDREKALDALRWRKIEEAENGHVFDFDALCAYKLRLLLLYGRRHRDRTHGRDVFNAILDEKAALAP